MVRKITLALSCLLLVTGTAFSMTATPEITLNPSQLPHFTCAAGETVKDTVLVNASNCSSYIEIKVLNQSGQSVFTINNSLMPANIQGGMLVITFHPLVAGEYSATLWWQTAGAQAQHMDLTGTATPAGTTPGEELVRTFTWDNQNPQKTVIERFDQVGHNKTLQLSGWQNVVTAGERPWWGIDQVNDEDMYCAKATAFVSGQQASDEWSMWLVTPALDYRNAPCQVFTFRVRGDYLQTGMMTALELYYVDATDPEDIYMQPLEVGIPSTADESGEWIDIHVDLTDQETIADVFYMAFRYVGPSGVSGAATYYVDDVTWGNPNLPRITADRQEVTFTTQAGVAEGTELHITGQNLTEQIQVRPVGDNSSSFHLATVNSTMPEEKVYLPAEGGLVAIALLEDVPGVYTAYLELSSRGAANTYIPMSVLVEQQTAIENTTTDGSTRKVIRNGQLLILRNGKIYSPAGSLVE